MRGRTPDRRNRLARGPSTTGSAATVRDRRETGVCDAAGRCPDGPRRSAARDRAAGCDRGDPLRALRSALAAPPALRARPPWPAAALDPGRAAPPGGRRSSGRRRPACSSPGPGWSRRPGRWSPSGGPPGCARRRACARWPTSAAGWAPTRSPRPAPGIRVYAVEADPLTAALAAANADRAPGSPTGSRSTCARRHGLRPVDRFDAVFCDPARRTAGRAPGVRPGGVLAAVGLRRRAGRRGCRVHGAQARARASTTRCCPPGAEGEMGQRRRRGGRGRVLVRRRWPGCRAGRP